MKTRRTRPTAIVAGLALLLPVLACRTEQAGSAERFQAVAAMVVQPQTHNLVRTFTGTLEGERQAQIYAKISESVTQAPVPEGQQVAAGQLLIRLDKDGPSARFAETESVYRNAEKQFRKMEYLFKEGAIAESDLDASRTACDVAKANFESVRQMVEIESPINGVLTSLKVSAGDFVGAGQLLATVATTKRLRIKFDVNSAQIGAVNLGSKLQVTSDAIADTVIGTVTSIAGSADPATRSFQVEAEIDNAMGRFRPGLFVTLSIVEAVLEHVIAVPHGAVQLLDNQPTLFTVENGVARKRVIVTGEELDGLVVVRSGLAAGDTLVTLGQNYLDEGVKVNITALTGAAR